MSGWNCLIVAAIFAACVGVEQLVVALDVVGHDDERPLLRRKADSLREGDQPPRLVAREDAHRGIDRLRSALAERTV